MRSLRSLSLSFACLIILFSTGCGCDPQPYNITVSIDDSLKNRTVYVDLVALNETMGQTLSSKSMTEYWRPNDALRGSLDLHDITFLAEDNAPRTLSIDDPIWETWADATDLYIIARLPGEFTDQPGQLDGRRLILPLGSCRWEDETIQIVIKPGLVTHTTKLLPEPE